MKFNYEFEKYEEDATDGVFTILDICKLVIDKNYQKQS
jgi:hypothetical protein